MKFVATFSLAQFLNHTVKVIIFTVAGFAWAEHGSLIVVAAAGVIVGTRVGARYLRRADPNLLDSLFKLAVTAGGLRLIVDLLW